MRKTSDLKNNISNTTFYHSRQLGRLAKESILAVKDVFLSVIGHFFSIILKARRSKVCACLTRPIN
jgi:hypothetical protein